MILRQSIWNSEEQKDEKEWRKANGTHRTQPNKTIATIWTFQRRIEKKTENIFKAIMAENFSKLETETSRSIRPKESQRGWTQTGVHQDTLNCLKPKTKKNFFF